MKIYSSRVDSVHNETYKVLGGLSRTEGVKPDDDEIQEEDADGEQKGDEENPDANPEKGGEEGKTTKQKKAKKPKKKRVYEQTGDTLEKNVASLNIKKLGISFTVDPLFRKTSEAFDSVGIRGLLLNHLSVYKGTLLVRSLLCLPFFRLRNYF